jgi:hypothetical protein
MRPLARLLLALAATLLTESAARAAEPLVAEPETEAERRARMPEAPPPADHGFTFGVHLGAGYPFLAAVPYEDHVFAATLGFRAGYRFAPWIAAYVDGSGFFSFGGAFPVGQQEYHPEQEPMSMIPLLALPVALRPIPWLEVSVAPALGVHEIAVFGGKGHLAVPLRAGRTTFSPTIEALGLTGQGWRQVALTAGLGVDW